MRTTVALLAAGAGTRFDGPTHKLNATIEGRPIAATAVQHALDADIGGVIVVVGATPLDKLPTDAQIVPNRSWADGQASSLAVAIEHAHACGADALVVALADQPFIRPDAWQRVAAARSPIAVATYDGRRGHPVRLARSVWPQVPATGDVGARELIRLRPDLVEAVPCLGASVDIDTWEDLLPWQNKSSTNSP